MNQTTEQGLPPLADLEQEIRSLSYGEKVELLEWMEDLFIIKSVQYKD